MTINTAKTDETIIGRETALPLRGERKNYFSDNLEHLQSLEHEAKIRLAMAYLATGKRDNREVVTLHRGRILHAKNLNEGEKPDLSFLELPSDKMTPDNIVGLLGKVQSENRAMELESIAHGVELNFVKVCKSYGLCEKERIILMLMFANNTGTSFRDLYEKCAIDRNIGSGGGMSVEALLAITSRSYREQIENRTYFSVESPLISEEMVMTWGNNYDATDNILDESMFLHERIIRYILGDNNTYDTTLRCIEKEKGNVNPDQIILHDNIKEDIFRLAQKYTTYSKKRKELGIDEFYAYGTGLVYLFYGPSGTGKTMLARALATKLDKTLLSLNIENISQVNSNSTSFEDIIKYAFKEARLTDGIVFLDECDDIFKDDSDESRALLVELEKSNCITILATNKAIVLDPSLDRRITMKVPLQIPSKVERKKIWKALLPPNVSFDTDVDIEQLARKYLFTGGFIKNSIFMAINNAFTGDDEGDLFLSMKALEKAADCQGNTFFEASIIETTYTPEIHIDRLPLRAGDKKELLNLASVYRELEDQGLGLNVLVGSTDIQTAIDAVDGVARASELKIRKFLLQDLLDDKMTKIKDPVTQKEVHHLDFAFSSLCYYRSATMLVDHDALFERYLERAEKEDSMFLFGFLEKLRAFRGMFFLVTRPMKRRRVPIEFNHYIEIKHPPEDLQIREWERHLNSTGNGGIVDLVERYPMHFREIDFITRQAKIRSHLCGDGSKISLDIVLRVIADYNKNKVSAPILFGGRNC